MIVGETNAVRCRRCGVIPQLSTVDNSLASTWIVACTECGRRTLAHPRAMDAEEEWNLSNRRRLMRVETNLSD